MIHQFKDGSPDSEDKAVNELLPLVYADLRRLAAVHMERERADHTLTPTSLLHEAYFRIVRREVDRFEDRSALCAAAAEAMRRILIEHARRHRRRQLLQSELPLPRVTHVSGLQEADIIEVDDVIEKLSHKHPEKAQLVKLRFFGGLSNQEAADAMGISSSTADRHWAYARAWLSRALLSQGTSGLDDSEQP
ncbi:MAG: sigma-70 family RNA polymerase sigma factor [Planctomycetaceae bacterium]|nr:sigma-70 family RNA polymerase sigma factor [Planctomycetaceae bacterium]